MIEVRTATVNDAKALAEMRWDFRSSQREPTELRDVFVRRCAQWMRKELQIGGMWHVWVAVDRHVVVGQLWVQVVPKIPNPNRSVEPEQLAYVSNLYVRPASRGGTGTRLLETALDWCRANQIDRVMLWPSRRSVSLYLGHGFSHGGEVMELKLRS